LMAKVKTRARYLYWKTRINRLKGRKVDHLVMEKRRIKGEIELINSDREEIQIKYNKAKEE